MFEVVVEYLLTGIEVEFGPFDELWQAEQVAVDACDEPDACYCIYKNGVLY